MDHHLYKLMPVLSWCIALLVLLFPILIPTTHGKGKFDWMGTDKFDEINNKISSIDAGNCRSKSKAELMLPKSVVSQLPVYNQLLSRTWYRNRTTLIHLHNTALNRAFFYSYILQRMNSTETFKIQPNWMYFYFSAVSDVNSNPNMINGSGIFFDSDCHYPNWYTTTPFNKTIPLFGPRAYRHDNYKDQGNFLREPSRTITLARDLGAGTNRNYTRPSHKMNPWYTNWLPDLTGDMDSLVKFSYYIGIKQSNQTGSFIKDNYEEYNFFGPASPGANEKDERKLPVLFTPPYFDCGQSNKWIVSAVAPVVDFMPRYSDFVHLRRARFVATISMDTDFQEIDFNACGVSNGNPGPSYLSGIDRCKPSTSCKHTPGRGFHRGGYVCVCKNGRRYPWWLDPPYKGLDIESATEREYKIGYSCSPIRRRLVMPKVDASSSVEVEGGASPLNSGGLNVRKRRHIYVNSSHIDTNTTHLNETDQWDDQDDVTRPRSPIEMMEFAERLREFKKEDLESLRKDIFMDISMTPQEVEQEYAMKNDIDWEVERMYQTELRDHETLGSSLAIDDDHTNFTRVMNLMYENAKSVREKHIERFQSERGSLISKRRKRASVFDQPSFDRMMSILRQKMSVTSKNCHRQPPHRLVLPGDTAYGVQKQFEPEGRTALRLAHFLSAFLQNASPDDNFGILKGGGRIQSDQMFGEVVANVMGNFRIFSAGVYFDNHKFENPDGSTRELFGPFAFRKKGTFFAYDSAGLKKSYINSDWFVRAKSRFGANFSGLKTYKSRTYIRSDSKGTMNIKHEYFPLVYKTTPYEKGFWTAPYFRCDGDVNAWVITHVTPFFGRDKFKKLQFRGVATVDVPLDLLEINQCPQPFTVPNAFKNTARCDYFSTNCAPQPGFYFRRGAYVCQCRLGFEYWAADGKEWFEGSYVEGEYERKRKGIFNRFDNLYCRPSSAPSLNTNVTALIMAVLVLFTRGFSSSS